MKKVKLKGDILSKVLKECSKNVIVAENLANANCKFILTEKVREIYQVVYLLADVIFKKAHQKYLAATDEEIDGMVANLNAQEISSREAIPEVTEKLVNINLLSADEIIEKYGDQTDVVASNELDALIAILNFYPTYVITRANYLLIRGGKVLMDDVMDITKQAFEGYVPGKFKFNEKNEKQKMESTAKISQAII